MKLNSIKPTTTVLFKGINKTTVLGLYKNNPGLVNDVLSTLDKNPLVKEFFINNDISLVLGSNRNPINKKITSYIKIVVEKTSGDVKKGLDKLKKIKTSIEPIIISTKGNDLVDNTKIIQDYISPLNKSGRTGLLDIEIKNLK